MGRGGGCRVPLCRIIRSETSRSPQDDLCSSFVMAPHARPADRMRRGLLRVLLSPASLLVVLLLALMLGSQGALAKKRTTDEVIARIRSRCNYTESELAEIKQRMDAYDESGSGGGGGKQKRGNSTSGGGGPGSWRDGARKSARSRCNYTDAEIAAMYARSPAPSPAAAKKSGGGDAKKGARTRRAR